MGFVWLLVVVVLRVRLRWFCSGCTARRVTLSGFWVDIRFGYLPIILVAFVACCLLLVGLVGLLGLELGWFGLR